jgi:flagellar secretion chaperone FliS
MQSSMARNSYLFTDVNTATPQKLQLLLIDAALTSANRARQFWMQQRDDLAIQALIHAQEVVGQVLADVNRDTGGDLATRILAVYEFIFRSLVNAGYRHDEKSLDDAIRILEIERETWRQLCDKLAVNAPHATIGDARPTVPHAVSGDADLMSLPGGFSIEA